ncbi:MAG: tRNA lysidine(34) synthetase TilS [Proteobacteria bacterium]|nr:tRNA lysidine(34) synthetase TilS [Pseudomonadota bacterium]
MDTATSLQTLPPQWAHFCLGIETFVRERIELTGSGIVVGVSGGIDSTALLHVLVRLMERNALRLHVAHLDHGLRPESFEDAAFVQALATSLNLPCTVEHVDVADSAKEHQLGIEEAGRELRYAFLEKVRHDSGCAWIATAHHADDLMEDVLMRLIRGTGWPGLAGMTAVDPKRMLLRPLLQTKKTQLQDFLRTIGQTWCEDPSNSDQSFTRNRVRSELLPLILDENPNFHITVARLWTQAGLDQDYFEQVVQELTLQQTDNSNTLHLDELVKVHPALRLRLYKHLLDALGPGQALSETLLALDRAVERGESPKPALFQFPGGKTVLFKGLALSFHSAPDITP